MKRIIQGKVYDTETATEVASQYHGYGGDFAAWREILYMTKSGTFFLHGWGSCRTEYAESTGQNSWSDGQRLIPYDKIQVMDWAERREVNPDLIAIYVKLEEA